MVDAVLHVLNYLKNKESYVPDVVFLLQPTSPLRDSQDIVSSFDLFSKNKAEALISVCRTHHEIWKIVNNKLKLVNPSNSKLINRQERQVTYRQDGSMIYIIKTDILQKHKDFIPDGTIAFIVPKWKAIDIDEIEDFDLAEVLYKNRKHFKNK